MYGLGLLLAFVSGVCNGTFSAPLKLERFWAWENTWLVFILTACVAMPLIATRPYSEAAAGLWSAMPAGPLAAAIGFGFLWGFGAICFGQALARLGIAVANSLVLGLSSALGSLVPIWLGGYARVDLPLVLLGIGVVLFILGVTFCAKAGRLRDGSPAASNCSTSRALPGYVMAVAAGVPSAIFNIGYTLASPMAGVAMSFGFSQFMATNYIWLVMLGAGAVPNVGYCMFLMLQNGTGKRLWDRRAGASFLRAVVMGLLWGGSIFLYGAATPRLGTIGPSVGWPLSLAVGLLVANTLGIRLGEWRQAPRLASQSMGLGIALLVLAIVLCALSSAVSR